MSTLAPEFLSGPSGKLFCLHYKPTQENGSSWPAIIHVPALMEEMNKSRRMVALQSRAFAEKGYPVYVFDLYGTGDSGGELEEMDWETWLKDLNFLCNYVQKRENKKIWLWGLRGGSLLASCAMQNINVVGGIYWQPVSDGQEAILQLKRLKRLAGDKGINDVQSGGGLEVSGYTFSQQLLEQLSKVSLVEERGSSAGKALILINISILPRGRKKEKVNQLLNLLQYDGRVVIARSVSGDPFWLTPEIVCVPDLLSKTSALFEQILVELKA